MEFYDAESTGVLPRVEVAEFQKEHGYIVQDEEILCCLLPEESTKGRGLQKYVNEELGWNADPRLLICKKILGRELLMGIPIEKARRLNELANRNKIRLYTGWTWLLEKMAETKKEDVVGFLLLEDCLYRGDLRRGIVEQCSQMNYLVFDGAEGGQLDFLKSSVWMIKEKEE